MRIRTILYDHGKESPTVSFALATGAERETEFDSLVHCAGPRARLTRLSITFKTNGMVERLNGAIEDVLQSHHFDPGKAGSYAASLPSGLSTNQQAPQLRLGSREHPCRR